jgi:hypothetical protein
MSRATKQCSELQRVSKNVQMSVSAPSLSTTATVSGSFKKVVFFLTRLKEVPLMRLLFKIVYCLLSPMSCYRLY